MAKFIGYEAKILKFTQTEDKHGRELKEPEEVTLDNVRLHFTKKVTNSISRGAAPETYVVPAADLPFLFLKPDVKLPAIAGDGNCEARIEAVHKLLAPYLDKNCFVEDVPSGKGSKRVIASIEFD